MFNSCEALDGEGSDLRNRGQCQHLAAQPGPFLDGNGLDRTYRPAEPNYNMEVVRGDSITVYPPSKTVPTKQEKKGIKAKTKQNKKVAGDSFLKRTGGVMLFTPHSF